MASVDSTAVTAEQRKRVNPVNFGSIYGMVAAELAAAVWNGYQVEMTLREERKHCERSSETTGASRNGWA